jgi:hypothetical protein
MAAQDFRTNANFARLPVTIRDARGQFMYVRIPASLFDTGTGAKTICNIPKGTRVLDVKASSTVAAGAANVFSVQTFDGSTTTTLLNGADGNVVGTTRAPGTTTTNPPEVLLNGTANTLIVNMTTATTTNGPIVLVLTLARENT